MRSRLRLVCVHQGVELYGSDRSFIQAVQNLRLQWPDAQIKVVLPGLGKINSELEPYVDHVEIRDILVLRRAEMLATLCKMIFLLPYYLLKAWRDFSSADMIYINTTVIADYMIVGRLACNRTIIHAREIPKANLHWLIAALVRWSRASIIFNSNATRLAFDLSPGQRSDVIYNGVDEAAPAPRPAVEFSASAPLRAALLGRINDWKGQDLLIDAVAMLPGDIQERLKVRIVGGTFEKRKDRVEALQASVRAQGLSDIISIEDFLDDPTSIYLWADIILVPSRRPEPFGRVAIEGMAFGRPVIASAQGGLVEIVLDGVTGWLFEPNNAEALSEAITSAVTEVGIIRLRGEASLARFRELFSSPITRELFLATISKWVPALANGRDGRGR